MTLLGPQLSMVVGSPLVRWATVNAACAYQVQFADNPSFQANGETPTVETPDANLTPGAPSAETQVPQGAVSTPQVAVVPSGDVISKPGTWYWRVRADFCDSDYGPWTPTRKFRSVRPPQFNLNRIGNSALFGSRLVVAGKLVHNGRAVRNPRLIVERRLPGELIASVGYVGNQTVRQFVDRDINAAPIGTGPTGRPLAATQNRLIETLMWDGWASSNYHSMQVALNRSFSKGFLLKGAYTWSKSINMADEDGWVALPLTNLESQLSRNRAVAGYDRTHMFVMSWVYDLPFGKGKALNLSGIADKIAGGWRLNGIYSAYTGTPFTVSAAATSLNAPGSNQTADQLGELVRTGAVGPGTAFYEVTAFRDPNFQRPSNVFRYGSMGRNAVRGPGFQKADLALFKDFKLTERFMLQFKAEAFNFTNTPRFGNPGANVSAMTLNAAGAVTNANNFMAITSAEGERKFRFGLRLSF